MGFFNDVKLLYTLKGEHLAVVKAVRRGASKDTLRDLILKYSADVNERDAEKKSALHFAVENGNASIVKVLIDSGAVIQEDDEEMTPIDLARDSHHPNKQEILLLLHTSNILSIADYMNETLQSLSKVALPMSDPGILLEAARSGNISILQTSLFDVNMISGCSLLYCAARHGQLAIVKWLVLERGAFLNIKNESEDKSTPLHGAAYSGHGEVVRFLLEAGADETMQNHHNELASHNAHNPRRNVTEKCRQECQSHLREVSLFEVVKSGRFSLIKKLKRADFYNHIESTGKTILYTAIIHEKITIINWMLINHTKAIHITNIDSNTPLHAAARIMNPKLVFLLLSYGASVNVINTEGISPLDSLQLQEESNDKQTCIDLLSGKIKITTNQNIPLIDISEAIKDKGITDTMNTLRREHRDYLYRRQLSLQTADVTSSIETDIVEEFPFIKWVQSFDMITSLGYSSWHVNKLITSTTSLLKKLRTTLLHALSDNGTKHVRQWMLTLCTDMKPQIAVELILISCCSSIDLGFTNDEAVLQSWGSSLLTRQSLSILDCIRCSSASINNSSLNVMRNAFRPLNAKLDYLLRILPRKLQCVYFSVDATSSIDVGSHCMPHSYTRIPHKLQCGDVDEQTDKLIMVAMKESSPSFEFLSELTLTDHYLVLGANICLEVVSSLPSHAHSLLQCPFQILIAQEVGSSWFTTAEQAQIFIEAFTPAIKYFRSSTKQFYIQQTCFSLDSKKPTLVMDKFMSWKSNLQKPVFCIMGARGMGKTRMCAEIFATLFERNCGGQKRDFPIYINLGMVSKEIITTPNGLDDYVLKQFIIEREATEFFVKKELNVILILDGFENLGLTKEELTLISNYKPSTNNLFSCNPWCAENAHLMITVNQQYFEKGDVSLSQLFGECLYGFLNSFSYGDVAAYGQHYAKAFTGSGCRQVPSSEIFKNPLFLSYAYDSRTFFEQTETEITRTYILNFIKKRIEKQESTLQLNDVLTTGILIACEIVNNKSSFVDISPTDDSFQISPTQQLHLKCLPVIEIDGCVMFHHRSVAEFLIAWSLVMSLSKSLGEMLQSEFIYTDPNIVNYFMELLSPSSVIEIKKDLILLIEKSKNNNQNSVVSTCLGLLTKLGHAMDDFNFDNLVISRTDLRKFKALRCSFKNTKFESCYLENTLFHKCDMTGSVIDKNCSLGTTQILTTNKIHQIMLSPKSDIIYAATSQGILSWDVATGGQLNSFLGHVGAVNTIVVTSENLISGGDDKKIIFWSRQDFSRTERTSHTGGVTALSISSSESLLISSGRDKKIVIWNVDTKRQKILIGHLGSVTSVSLSHNELSIVSCSSEDSLIIIWCVTTGTIKHRINHKNISGIHLTSDNRKIIAIGGRSCIYDFENLSTFRVLPYNGISILVDDGSKMISFSKKLITVWDPYLGIELYSHTCSVKSELSDACSSSYNNHTTIAYCSESSIFITNLTSKPRSVEYQPQDSSFINTVCVVSTEQVLTGSESGQILMWDITNKEVLKQTKHNKAIRAISMTPDGHMIIAAGDSGMVTLMDMNLTHVKTVPGHTGAVTCLRISPCGLKILTGGVDQVVKLWIINSSSEIMQTAVMTYHTDIINDVIFFADKIASCSRDNTVRVAYLNGTEIHCLQHNGMVTSLALCYSSKVHLLSGSVDGGIRIWDVIRGDEIQITQTNENIKSITSSAGRIIASYATGGIQFWDETPSLDDLTAAHPSLSTSQIQMQFAHNSSTKLSSSNDGSILCTVSESAIRVWTFDNNALVLLMSSGGNQILPEMHQCVGNPLTIKD